MLLVRNAQVIDPNAPAQVARGLLDLRVHAGRIVEIGTALALSGEQAVEARGAAVVPGLHDHHLHLFAMAAALGSVQCGPPAVRDAAELAAVLRAAARVAPVSDGDPWLRGIGYHESVAGELDAARLDALVPERPLRIQHRGGALWMVNSAGADRLGLARAGDLPGVERDAEGRPNGRLFRLDDWLAQRTPRRALDLAGVSRMLASRGVTGVTEASPGNGEVERDQLRELQVRGELVQHLRLMGDEGLRPISLEGATGPSLHCGELKVLLDEHALPGHAELSARIAAAHAVQRGVALHCITKTELVFAATALVQAGARTGDRIEHASEAEAAVLELLRQSGSTVVTQPNFVRERGDQYLAEVEPSRLDHLYRGHGFDAAGIPLAAGTDAPYGTADPWLAMAAAVDRRTATGRLLGAREALSPERALRLFCGDAAHPGGRARTLSLGARADLCILDRPWQELRSSLATTSVVATVCAGRLVHQPAAD